MSEVKQKIWVKNHDLGFFTQQPITAQRFEEEDGEQVLVWCDHAGAIAEEVENQMPRMDAPDIVWISTVIICDKCPAYKLEGDDYWQDAPFEGVTL